jgi:hypothetical protein
MNVMHGQLMTNAREKLIPRLANPRGKINIPNHFKVDGNPS